MESWKLLSLKKNITHDKSASNQSTFVPVHKCASVKLGTFWDNLSQLAWSETHGGEDHASGWRNPPVSRSCATRETGSTSRLRDVTLPCYHALFDDCLFLHRLFHWFAGMDDTGGGSDTSLSVRATRCCLRKRVCVLHAPEKESPILLSKNFVAWKLVIWNILTWSVNRSFTGMFLLRKNSQRIFLLQGLFGFEIPQPVQTVRVSPKLLTSCFVLCLTWNIKPHAA